MLEFSLRQLRSFEMTSSLIKRIPRKGKFVGGVLQIYVKIGGPTGDPFCVAATLLVDTDWPVYSLSLS